MEGVNTTASTLRAPSIVAAMKDLYWGVMAINVEVILESVDSVCMDSSNMQYMRIQKIPQILKISELISLY